MFHYLPQHTGDLVAVRTTGKIDKADLDLLLPEVEDLIRRHGKVSFYWEMVNFDGWEPLSFLRDMLFDIKHAADFRRIAMVGEKGWEEKMSGIMRPFTKAELKYFDLDDREDAMKWVQEA